MAGVPVKVPSVGESITEGILARWLKPDGSVVKAGEPLFELESDKASLPVTAEVAGLLKVQAAEGDTVTIGQVIGTLDPAAIGSATVAGPKPAEPATAAAPVCPGRSRSQAPAATAGWPPCPWPRRSAGSSPSRAPTQPRSRGPAATAA